MKGWKKIREWRHKWFVKKYVITGATQMGWKVYVLGGEPQKVRVFKDSFLLKGKALFGNWKVTREIKSARQVNGVVGTILTWWLKRKFDTLFFRLVVPSHASFIPGIKTRKIESPIGAISFEN